MSSNNQMQKFNESLFYLAAYTMMMQSNMNQGNLAPFNFQDHQKIIPFSPTTQSAFKPFHNDEQFIGKNEDLKKNNNQRQKKIKKTITLKKNNTEQDYTPDKDSKKKQNKTHQNQNRNILPNFLNQTLSFVQKKTKSGLITQKIFSKISPNQQWTPDRYYLYMKRVRDRLNHYVNQQNLKLIFQIQEPQYQLFSKEQQMFYLRVTKILMRNFFHQSANIVILTSKRMHSSKRKDHLAAKRLIYNEIKYYLDQN